MIVKKNPSSFRDPSGSVFEDGDFIIRTVNNAYARDWSHIRDSGLLEKAGDRGMLLPIEELAPAGVVDDGNVRIMLRSRRLPFVSYPYEWSFSQLRDAALLTLDLHMLALGHGCVLKDASAYNIVFDGAKPVFIDTLSFEIRKDERPWEAYGQFCRHFLAPLALESYIGPDCGRFSRQWIDGIPLDLACAMLPKRALLQPALLTHLFAHSKMQSRYGDGMRHSDRVKKARLNARKMLYVAESLQSAVSGIRAPAGATEWVDYYSDTNYSAESMRAKENIVTAAAKKYGNKNLALDLGANDGHFSRIISPYFRTVIAADIDPGAVDAHYLQLGHSGVTNILPLVQDLTSPSPALGWNLGERASFLQRARADMLLALALCHHLYFTGGIPFAEMGIFFAGLLLPGGVLCVEFVPADDSQVQRLLAARSMETGPYNIENFCNALNGAGLKELDRRDIPGTKRTCLLFGKNWD